MAVSGPRSGAYKPAFQYGLGWVGSFQDYNAPFWSLLLRLDFGLLGSLGPMIFRAKEGPKKLQIGPN